MDGLGALDLLPAADRREREDRRAGEQQRRRRARAWPATRTVSRLGCSMMRLPSAIVANIQSAPPGATRGRGGIGRHAGFRCRWRKPWGFKSLRPHMAGACSVFGLTRGRPGAARGGRVPATVFPRSPKVGHIDLAAASHGTVHATLPPSGRLSEAMRGHAVGVPVDDAGASLDDAGPPSTARARGDRGGTTVTRYQPAHALKRRGGEKLAPPSRGINDKRRTRRLFVDENSREGAQTAPRSPAS